MAVYTSAFSGKEIDDAVRSVRPDGDIYNAVQSIDPFNPANLIEDPGFNDPTKWFGDAYTFITSGFPAKIVHFSTDVVKGQYVRQFIPSSKLESGTYYLDVVFDEPAKYNVIEAIGVKSDYSTETLLTVRPDSTVHHFEFSTSTYSQLEIQLRSNDTTPSKMSKPMLFRNDRQSFYKPDIDGLYSNAGLVPQLSADLSKLKADFDKSSFINSKNKILNAAFDGSANWSSFSATIMDIGLPANAISMTNSGQSVYVRQFQPISNFTSGRYYLSMNWLSGVSGKIEFRAYLTGTYNSELLCTVTHDTIEEDKFFDFDVSKYDQIDVAITLGDITTCVYSNPILALVESDEVPAFYNKPYEKIFDAVNEVDKLKQTDVVSKLFGKILSVNGDSIAEGVSNGGGYAKQIAEQEGMTYQNVAVSGGTIVPVEGKYSIVNGVSSMRLDADYILLEGGVNDTYVYGRGEIELGTIGDDYKTNYDTSTYCNAFQKMLYDVYQRFPTKKILYISVHNHGNWKEGNDIYDATIAMCKKWGVQICNLTENTAPLGRMTNLRTYTTSSDGQHPTAEGYELFYTPKIIAAMLTL